MKHILPIKVLRADIPADSLAAGFLPTDHSDAYLCRLNCDEDMSPEEIVIGFFTRMPPEVGWLFRLRDFLVRPFGLKGAQGSPEDFAAGIREGKERGMVSVPARSQREIVLRLADKHLDAHLSVCVKGENAEKDVCITTLVRYNNTLGKVYFNLIRPFHHIVVRRMTKYTLRRLYM